MVLESPKNKDNLTTKIEISLPTDINLVHQTTQNLANKMTELGWNEMDVGDLQTAFHEALVNAIAHGNLGIKSVDDIHTDISSIANIQQRKNPTNKKVEIYIEIDRNTISIKIKDEGEGFKPEKVADSTSLEGLEKTEGRGLLLMKALADSVVYNDKGNEVTMTKKKSKVPH